MKNITHHTINQEETYHTTQLNLQQKMTFYNGSHIMTIFYFVLNLSIAAQKNYNT